MVLCLKKTKRQTWSIRASIARGLVLIAFAAPLSQVSAYPNNSGRYVVTDQQGVWQAVQSGDPSQGGVFYPSWYVGAEVSKTEWDLDELKNMSTGAGLLVGNHFSPHLRWEVRHGFQNPDKEFTGLEGEDYTLSTLSLDYLVSTPKDGFSPVLRGGAGIAEGDGFSDDQNDVEALLGLGLQWREDRWIVRLMAEQMGQDLSWAGMTLAAYLGGNEQKTREKMQRPTPAVEQVSVEAVQVPEVEVQKVVPSEDVVISTPTKVVEPVVVTTVIAATPAAPAPSARQTQQCGRVFSTRVLEGIDFISDTSELLTAESKKQLNEIGKAYARRSYIDVDVKITAETQFLAELRADSVISALNTFGVLDDRISSEVAAGSGSLSLSMKDTRGCGSQ